MAETSSLPLAGEEEKSIGFEPTTQGDVVAGLSLRDSIPVQALHKVGLFTTNERVSVDNVLPSSLPPASSEKVSVQAKSTIGPKHGSKLYRGLRWTLFTVYRRLFTFCFAANAIALIAVGTTDNLDYMNSASAAAINILVALLARQEHVVNFLFLSATAVPTSWPLWMRRRIAKIYCYGGWHSGCGVAGAIWYVVFAGFATYDYIHSQPTLLPTLIISYINISMLLLIVIFAYPTMRMKLHDYFEITHRFAGWTIVGFFWAQVILLATVAPASTGIALVNLPAFWCLVIITIMIVYPWIRLRHRTVYFEYLSTHAVRLHFVHAALDYCVGVRLSTNPLMETHSFATIPNKPEQGKGFSVLISNAGDWTRRTIQSAAPLAAAPLPATPPEPATPPVIRTGPCQETTPPQWENTKAAKHASTISTASVLSTSSTSALLPSALRAARTPLTSHLSIPAHWQRGHIYTRGAPIYGVLRIADLFVNPLIVTTGSGIGPCLSLLAGRPGAGTTWTCRLLWATKAPLATYGKSVVDDVKRADPWARVVDTGAEGRPDMLQLSWEMWRESGNVCGGQRRAEGKGQSRGRNAAAWDEEKAVGGPVITSPWRGQRSEAVVVISNPKVTRKVVYGLESRGVPAFGVIFDS